MLFSRETVCPYSVLGECQMQYVKYRISMELCVALITCALYFTLDFVVSVVREGKLMLDVCM